MSTIPNVLRPALDEDMREGAGVSVYSPDGDPREPGTDLSGAYLVPRPFYLQPLFFVGCVEVRELSSEERARLSAALGSPLSREVYRDLQSLSDDLIITLILKDRLPSYNVLHRRLQEICTALTDLEAVGRDLLNLTGYHADPGDRSAGFLTVDQCIKIFLSQQNAVLSFDTRSFRKALEPELHRLQAIVSRRGRKPDTEIKLFLERICSTALRFDILANIPTNGIRDGVAATTPFFEFTKAFCAITYDLGVSAIAGGDFSAKERLAASGRLKLLKKQDGALVEHLRSARKAAGRSGGR